jgi:hypothetical protein
MTDGALWGVVGTVIGTILGAVLSLGKDWLNQRGERKRHSVYLAVRITCILDTFIAGCVDVVYGAGNGDSHLPEVHNPQFPAFPDDLDWKAITPELMYQILAFPNEIKTADSSISFVNCVIAWPPDYDEAVDERKYQYALLGLKAERLANKLRKTYAIPWRDDGDRNPDACFQKSKGDIEAARGKRDATSAALVLGDAFIPPAPPSP